MGQRLKVHELLDRDELDQLEAFAREPGRTIEECQNWLVERHFAVSYGGVRNWKIEFDGQLMKDRFSRSSDLAKAMKGAVDKGSFDEVAEAAVMQLTQVVFEQASQLEAEGSIDPLDVQRMTRSLRNLIGGKADLIKLLAAKFEREMNRQLGLTTERKLTPEQIAAAGKAIFGS